LEIWPTWALVLLAAAGLAVADIACPGSWQQVAAAGPPGRNHHAMAYGSDRQRVVLFGSFQERDSVASGIPGRGMGPRGSKWPRVILGCVAALQRWPMTAPMARSCSLVEPVPRIRGWAIPIPPLPPGEGGGEGQGEAESARASPPLLYTDLKTAIGMDRAYLLVQPRDARRYHWIGKSHHANLYALAHTLLACCFRTV
jgi:hypothetical protein